MARSKRTARTAGSSDAAPSARVTSNDNNNSNTAALGKKKKKQQTLQDWTGGPIKSKSAEGGQKRWHNNNERKKDKQSLGLFLMRHLNRDFSVPQKLHTRLSGRNEAMQGATHPGQTFQGRCDQASEDDVRVEN
ncbi:hypothetical protein QTG54_015949 [Skeletonema marinoi]|uniref:Uncharacterized protein n=1 Tax=Skeletonema marinoi TaxID=267567 RepID=A0AAD8XU22_9STRA|nr:hypothetical protein QTG54_015949 [Skeletonema marinoi]